MKVTFLNEVVQARNLNSLVSYLKAKAKENPDCQKLLDKYQKEKNDWTLTYPDFKTPSDWFPLGDGSIIIGCCDENSAFPLGDGYPFTFVILRLDENGDAKFHWAAVDYPIIIYSDVFTDDEELWTTEELQKVATNLAKKLTAKYANKDFADYPSIKKFMGEDILQSVRRTGEPLRSLKQKPDSSQKIEVTKR